MEILRKLFVAVLAILAGLTTSASAQNQDFQNEKVALLVKPAVVRIYDGYAGTAEWQSDSGTKTYDLIYVGSGSGAFVDSNGYIVTNAHVIGLTHESKETTVKLLLQNFAEQVARDSQLTTDQFDEQDWEAVRNAFVNTVKLSEIQTVVLPNGDKYPFEFTSGIGSPAEDDVAVIKIKIKNAPILKLADSDEVRVQDHITVVGYPAAAESTILDEKSLLESSITDGKVSAKKSLANGSPVLEVSAPATHGSSGGPVVNDAGEIVGLLTFGGDDVNGQEIQGFNFVVASNTVKEFVKKAGADNKGETADNAYREGLDLYFNGKYRSALEKFQQVNELFPQHSEIKPLIKECEIKKNRETDFTGLGVMALGMLVLSLVGGILMIVPAIIFYRLARKKLTNDRSSAAGYAPSYIQSSAQNNEFSRTMTM